MKDRRKRAWLGDMTVALGEAPRARRRRVPRALIGFLIVVAVIAAVAIGLVWASGSLGPVTATPLTAAEAQASCEETMADPSGRLTDQEFTNMAVTRSRVGWRVRGTMKATNVHGARLARDFECLVEHNRGSWGVTSNWTSTATTVN